ncbi:AraC family transcriptional regulator [Rhizobium sp. LC145]|jgi:AraC-like DNA-binding protein|uniref:AraC family transcriptional regulator n=1 Tax=Rhizobium sp. LC145 TaxID=1120688 RepID=UPI000629FE1D|nr:AraC family transcriptional regulator [Rhizobium sp. LC145]KKX27130.1 AraC family transcriptional regulator [Rhizobium sp. LC145]TKT56550.1 AraC family transcriptional regulator [Rhizobiaceae bacterium LC148]
MDVLKDAVRAYVSQHGNHEGLAPTPVPGLRLKCVEAPHGDLHAITRPLVIIVLQGTKRMVVGREERIFSAGQSAIVSADMPIVTRIERASPSEPYMAIAIEIEMAMLSEAAAHLGPARLKRRSIMPTLFTEDTEAAALDCVFRLMRLCDQPTAIPLLHPGIMRELHFWLLSGKHGPELATLCDPASHANRLAAAVAILRAEYRSRISTERLAAAAGMGLTAFHTHFKRMLSLSPGQYQKRLRLIEARRLMLDEGLSASSAAFDVGYESVSQFTREYGRLFKVPPKRDVLRIRSMPTGVEEWAP